MTRILSLLSGGAGGWILAVALLLASALGAAGGYEARGLLDAVPLAHQETATARQQTAVAQCGTAREKDRADTNAATSGALADGGKKAAAADQATDAKEGVRKSGYQAAQQESAKNAAPISTRTACIDPEPLRLLFSGMLDADAAAAAGNQNGAGDPAAAFDKLPKAAANQ